MSWFKLDDQFASHPKVLRAGPDAAWLYVCGGLYCAKHLTDGSIPKVAVPTLTTLKNAARLAGVLVRENLWSDDGDDYHVHDYLDFNPSREQVLSQRHSKSMAGAKGAAARWHRNGDAPDPSPTPQLPSVTSLVALEGSPKKRGTRIPDTFSVDQSMQDWARNHAPGVDWELETTKFVNYWKAKPGKDAVKLDWGRTWQNWLLTAQARVKSGPTRTHL